MATITTRGLALLLAGIACFVALDCLAVASLNGVVRKNQLGGKPLARVSVSAPDAGGPSATDDRGRFKLEFPRLVPGDKVDLDVKLKGWVIVNYLQLAGHNLPKEARANPLTILLAREAERERYALQYYRLKGNAAVLAEYQRKLAEQTQQNQTTAQLAHERDKALALVDELAKQLAAAKPGAGDELYRQAMQLFLSNRLDEALVLLNEQKLQADADQALLLEKNARKKKEEAAKNYRLWGRHLSLRLKFDNAAKAYLAATVLLPDDFQTWFEFAKFHQELNHLSEALRGYEKALALTRADTNRPELAKTLNNLAILHKKQNRFEEAHNAYQEALTIYRDLARTNPDTYLHYVAIALNNLANMHKDQNRFEEALKAYEEALVIYRDLARTNPDTYRPDLATFLTNLANLHSNQNHFEEASRAYEEALTIYRDLARTNPDTYRPYVATVLNNLANQNGDQKRLEETSKTYEEALTIYRDLARTNPDTYLPYMAAPLNNLAILHTQGRFEEALKAYEEALTIYRALARTNPDTYRPDVALTLNNLAVLHITQGSSEEAKKANQEALDIYREFAARNPERYGPSLRKAQSVCDLLTDLVSE